MPRKSSLAGLFRALTTETRAFIQQEIQLAKTELSEKVASLSRNAVTLVVGGAVAYAGLLVFLLGLGYLLAWVFHLAGLEPIFAAFVGFVGIGLFVGITGCLLLLKGIQNLSQEKLVPERTLTTLEEIKGGEPAIAKTPPKPEPEVSSAEMQARVEATEHRIGETIEELGRRVSPHHLNVVVKRRISANPYRSGLVAMVAGVLGGVFLRRRFSATS